MGTSILSACSNAIVFAAIAICSVFGIMYTVLVIVLADAGKTASKVDMLKAKLATGLRKWLPLSKSLWHSRRS